MSVITVSAKFKRKLKPQPKNTEVPFVPYKDYAGLRQTSGGSNLSAARLLTRGVLESVKVEEPKLMSAKVSLAKNLRQLEAARLIPWAQERGLILDAASFEKDFKSDKPHFEGGEHKVVIDEKLGIVTKQRQLVDANSTIFKALRNVELHNLTFPETAYTFKGFMQQPKELVPVYTQAFAADYGQNMALKLFGIDRDYFDAVKEYGTAIEKKTLSAWIDHAYKELMTVAAGKEDTQLVDRFKGYLTHPTDVGQPTLQEVVDYMAIKEFIPVQSIKQYRKVYGTDDQVLNWIRFINKKGDLYVDDLAPRNWVRQRSGNILAIDPRITLV